MIAIFHSSERSQRKIFRRSTPMSGMWLIYDPEESSREHDISVPEREYGDLHALYEAGWVVAHSVPGPSGKYVVVERPREWPSSFEDCRRLEQTVASDMLKDEWLNPLIECPAGYRVMIKACDAADQSVPPEEGRPVVYQARLEALAGPDGIVDELRLFTPGYQDRVPIGWQPIHTATAPGGDWAGRIDPVACLDLTRQIAKDYRVDPADLVTSRAFTANVDHLTELDAAIRPFNQHEAVPPPGTIIVSPDTGTWQVTAASRERWFYPSGGYPKRYIDVWLVNSGGDSLNVTRWGDDKLWGVELWVKQGGDLLQTHDIQQRGMHGIAAKPLADKALAGQLDKLCASSFKDLWRASPWQVSPDKTTWIALPEDSSEPCTLREALCRAAAIGDSKDNAVALAQLRTTNPSIARQVTERRNGLLQATTTEPALAFSEQQAVWRQRAIEQMGAGKVDQIAQMGNQLKIGMQ